MLIHHHQFKNALLHLSEEIQKAYRDKKIFLERASRHPWTWRFHLIYCLPAGQIGDNSLPAYSVRFDEIGNEEILRLKETFVEVNKIDIALELANGFLRTLNSVLEAHLSSLLIDYHFWEIFYQAKTDNDDWLMIRVRVDINENRVVSSKIEARPK